MARLDLQRPPSKKHARVNSRDYVRGYDTMPHDPWGEASTIPAPPAAFISSVTPRPGTTAGGTPITIIGGNFNGATSVTIGGTACTAFVVVNNATITCTTPAGTAGAKTVIVVDPDGNGTKASGFTY